MLKQLRNFMFTWNNPGQALFNNDDVDEAALTAHEYLKIQFEDQTIPLSFITYGEEYGEEGTFHFQGYCELSKRVSFNRVKDIFVGSHLEPRRGTQRQAIEYCRKGGKYISYGEPKIQGDRTDLQHTKSLLDANSSVKTLLNDGEITTYQGLRLAEALLRYCDTPRNYKPEVLWFYGSTGSGKTRTALRVLPNAYFKTNVSPKWWPGYDGEEDIIIDDLRPSVVSYLSLLGYLDRYSFQVEDKGITRQFRGRRIIITAPCVPEEMYKEYNEIGDFTYKESMSQLHRRIMGVINFDARSEMTFDEARAACAEMEMWYNKE